MVRGRLHLVEGEHSHMPDQFRQLLHGWGNLDSKIVLETVKAIDRLLNSIQFSGLRDNLLVPFQQIVEVALRVKELQCQEIVGLPYGEEAFIGVRRNIEASQSFKQKYDKEVQDRWGCTIDEATLEQLMVMWKDLDYRLSFHLAKMSSKLAILKKGEVFLCSAGNERAPLVYMILQTLYEKLCSLINELSEQLSQCEYSVNVLFAPLSVNHLLNDELLVRLGRAVQYLRVLVHNISSGNCNSKQILEIVLKEAQIFPAYHDKLNAWDWSFLKLNKFSSEKSSDIINSQKMIWLVDFVNSELPKMNPPIVRSEAGVVANFVQTDSVSAPFSEFVINKRKKTDTAELVLENRQQLIKLKGIIEVEDLSDAIAKLCEGADPVKTYQVSLLNAVSDLAMEGYIDEADTLHRAYLMLVNFGLSSEHNQKGKLFVRWQKNISEQTKLLQMKRRLERGMHSAEVLPAADASTSESASTESSTATKPTEPTRR